MGARHGYHAESAHKRRTALKLTVKKRLSKGIYWVEFVSGELSEVEKRQIDKFGAPSVGISYGDPEHLAQRAFSIHEIDDSHSAGFRTAEEACAYANTIVSEVREKLSALMKETDEFTSEDVLDI